MFTANGLSPILSRETGSPQVVRVYNKKMKCIFRKLSKELVLWRISHLVTINFPFLSIISLYFRCLLNILYLCKAESRVCQSIFLPVSLFVCPSVCLPVGLPAHLYVCLIRLLSAKKIHRKNTPVFNSPRCSLTGVMLNFFIFCCKVLVKIVIKNT